MELSEFNEQESRIPKRQEHALAGKMAFSLAKVRCDEFKTMIRISKSSFLTEDRKKYLEGLL